MNKDKEKLIVLLGITIAAIGFIAILIIAHVNPIILNFIGISIGLILSRAWYLNYKS